MEGNEGIPAGDASVPEPPRRPGRAGKAIAVLAVLVVVAAAVALTYATVDVERTTVLEGDGLTAEGDICGYIDIVDGRFAYTGEGEPEWSYTDLSLTHLVEVSPGRYDERPCEVLRTDTFDVGPGYYEVTLSVDGKDVGDGLMTVDGDLTRTYEWDYYDYIGGKLYHMDVDYTYRFSDYMGFRAMEPNRDYDATKSDARFLDTGPLVEALVEQLEGEYLEKMGPGASVSGEEYVNYLLSFVQVAIVYPDMVEPDGDGYVVSESDDAAGDYVLYGSPEHWSFPIETLHLSSGDCKNTSLLLDSMLSVAGFDSYIITLETHVLCAVELDHVTEHDAQYLVFDHRQFGGRQGIAYSMETTMDISIPVGYVTPDVVEEIGLDTTVVTFVPAKPAVRGCPSPPETAGQSF